MEDYLGEVNAVEDDKIVELFEKRSESSIAELSSKYGAICQSVIQRLLGDFTDVEQCLNDTYFKVWNSIPPAKPVSLSAFTAAIARNIALSLLRERRTAKRGGEFETVSFDELDDLVSGKSSVESEAERHELVDAINKFLFKQSEIKRQLFINRYWGCRSIAELARSFGMTESNVTVTLTRLRKKLKEYLYKRGVEI